MKITQQIRLLIGSLLVPFSLGACARTQFQQEYKEPATSCLELSRYSHLVLDSPRILVNGQESSGSTLSLQSEIVSAIEKTGYFFVNTIRSYSTARDKLPALVEMRIDCTIRESPVESREVSQYDLEKKKSRKTVIRERKGTVSVISSFFIRDYTNTGARRSNPESLCHLTYNGSDKRITTSAATSQPPPIDYSPLIGTLAREHAKTFVNAICAHYVPQFYYHKRCKNLPEVELGFAAMAHQKEYKKAESYIRDGITKGESLVKLKPRELAEAYFLLGLALAGQLRYDESLSALEKSALLFPDGKWDWTLGSAGSISANRRAAMSRISSMKKAWSK